MKMRFLSVLLVAVLPATAQSQTLIRRTMVSTGDGHNFSPIALRLPNGNFAFVWGWSGTGDNDVLTPYGRVMKPDGTPATPVRKNLLTAPLYPYQHPTAGLTAGGRVLVVGTRESDSRIIARPFDTALRAKGAMVPTGAGGYTASVVPGAASGAVMAFLAGVSEIVPLNEAGRTTGNPLALQSPDSTADFIMDQVVTAPGGYLVAGSEYKSAKGRAAAFYLPADLSTVSAMILYENGRWSSPFLTQCAFDGSTGLTLFGHSISDSKSSGFVRQLTSQGKPSGAPKKFPSGVKLSSHYRIVPLTGSGRFAAAWLSGYLNGYVQVLGANGSPVGSPVPIAEADYTINLAYVGMAWDPTSSTLAVVYSNLRSEPDYKYELWAAFYKVE